MVKLFNFLKRPAKVDVSPEQVIRHVMNYMPEYYNTHRQFVNGVEFLDNREWALALDSFIQLANETGHYFSEAFWLALADAAGKMNLADKANDCRKQISRNEQDLTSRIPFGMTVVKFDNNHLQYHISGKLKEEWATERRKKDKVKQWLTRDGVHMTSHGRSGFLYIVDKGRMAEVEYELGMNGLILYFSRMAAWVLPVKQPLTSEEKASIRVEINSWAKNTGNAIQFDS